ncbi:HesB/YadR/YfhF family protein [Metabacillus fastidiosus]|uniref:HesB/YadR/YfhF family protein n=1 Tax=Metabacillus fastidiosus TaxID=1458 RepID=UPI003D2E1A8C
MNLNVSREAAVWYASEMDLKPGDYLQFVVKIYGGIPTVHPDYYLGISIGKEGSIGIKNVVEGITFYFSVEDSWFLKEYDLDIIKKDNDVEYIFK